MAHSRRAVGGAKAALAVVAEKTAVATVIQAKCEKSAPIHGAFAACATAVDILGAMTLFQRLDAAIPFAAVPRGDTRLKDLERALPLAREAHVIGIVGQGWFDKVHALREAEREENGVEKTMR